VSSSEESSPDVGEVSEFLPDGDFSAEVSLKNDEYARISG